MLDKLYPEKVKFKYLSIPFWEISFLYISKK